MKSKSVADATKFLSPLCDPGRSGSKRIRSKIHYALKTKSLLLPLTEESLLSWAIAKGYKGLGTVVDGVSTKGAVGSVFIVCTPDDPNELRAAYQRSEVERQQLLTDASRDKCKIKELEEELATKKVKDEKLHRKRVESGKKGGRGKSL